MSNLYKNISNLKVSNEEAAYEQIVKMFIQNIKSNDVGAVGSVLLVCLYNSYDIETTMIVLNALSERSISNE